MTEKELMKYTTFSLSILIEVCKSIQTGVKVLINLKRDNWKLCCALIL